MTFHGICEGRFLTALRIFELFDQRLREHGIAISKEARALGHSAYLVPPSGSRKRFRELVQIVNEAAYQIHTFTAKPVGKEPRGVTPLPRPPYFDDWQELVDMHTAEADRYRRLIEEYRAKEGNQ